MDEPPSTTAPGVVLDGRFKVVRLIGRGGTAAVWEAQDLESGQAVALKVLHRALARSEDARARFDAEARALTRVQHPNVAGLHAAGMADSTHPYLVLELLRGRSLARVLDEERRLEPQRAARYVWHVLDALYATHGLGILHRDLKPGNIMLEPADGGGERIVVIDFGFASFDAGKGITAPGFVVGSLSYLPPERLRGEPADARSDVYSMGVVFYELLAGARPFEGDESAIVRGHLDGTPRPPSAAAPDARIPPAFDRVVLRALAKAREARPQSAMQMAYEIALAAGWR